MQVHGFRQHMKAMRSHYSNDVFLKYTLPLDVIDDHNIYNSFQNLSQKDEFSFDLEMKDMLNNTQEGIRQNLNETQENITQNAKNLGESPSPSDIAGFRERMNGERQRNKSLMS